MSFAVEQFCRFGWEPTFDQNQTPGINQRRDNFFLLAELCFRFFYALKFNQLLNAKNNI